MPLTIDIDDREWDVENILNALKIPAERNYVAEVTTDEPAAGRITFTGDVQLRMLDGHNLLVTDFFEDDPERRGPQRSIPVADIRRISFY